MATANYETSLNNGEQDGSTVTNCRRGTRERVVGSLAKEISGDVRSACKLIDRGEHEDGVGKTNDKTNPQLDEGCSPNYA
jgi:hypothetical protein